jgi:catechol 2,3-dioxygenase-like lactoylglutathione lyase family enzyme
MAVTGRGRTAQPVQVGFDVDWNHTPMPGLRFVQLTPPGSACSIAFGTGLGIGMEPGSLQAIQVVVPDADEARRQLLDHGVAASEVDEHAWGRFVTFKDPDGNGWTLQQLPKRGSRHGLRAGCRG